jgi:hypothetical protein
MWAKRQGCGSGFNTFMDLDSKSVSRIGIREQEVEENKVKNGLVNNFLKFYN